MTQGARVERHQQEDERPSALITKRVRRLVAELQVRGTTLARELELDQRAFSRRYRGEVAWSVDELVVLAPLLGTTFEGLCAIRDSNPEPADYVAPVLRLLAGGRKVVAALPTRPPLIPQQRPPTPLESARRRRHLAALPSTTGERGDVA